MADQQQVEADKLLAQTLKLQRLVENESQQQQQQQVDNSSNSSATLWSGNSTSSAATKVGTLSGSSADSDTAGEPVEETMSEEVYIDEEGIDEEGIDEKGIDERGIDESGVYGETFFIEESQTQTLVESGPLENTQKKRQPDPAPDPRRHSAKTLRRSDTTLNLADQQPRQQHGIFSVTLTPGNFSLDDDQESMDIE